MKAAISGKPPRSLARMVTSSLAALLVGCGGEGGSGPAPCGAVPGATTVNIGSTTGGTYWTGVGSTSLGFNNTNLNFYAYISGDWFSDQGAACLSDVTAWPATGSGPVAYTQGHVYAVRYQEPSNHASIRYYKFIASAYSQGSVTITWAPMFGATATTTAQALIVGTSMRPFSPLAPIDGATPYTYSYTGTLPAGLSFDSSTGLVTGTPTTPRAAANLVFSVRDANHVVASTSSTVSFSVAAETRPYVVQGGLTWMPVTFSDTWANARGFCMGTIDGQTGWRQPTDVELSALYASGAMAGQGWTLDYTWSSSLPARVYPVCMGGTANYNGVSLMNGSVSATCDVWSLYVSCVR